MDKPAECTPLGTYGCTIPMPVRHAVRHIDFCVADLVAALNAAHIWTTWSCCGHGEMDAEVGLEDGRILVVRNGTGSTNEEATDD